MTYFDLLLTYLTYLNFSDYPSSCQDAKDNYALQYNSVLLIDIDGAEGDEEGNLDPFYVHFDVETHPNQAITSLPHKQ